MKTCVDSSFLVSSYIEDAHSQRVDRRIAGAPNIVLTTFNRAELANAIYQQVFLKRLPMTDAQAAFGSFESDCKLGVWKLVEVPSTAWERSVDLSRRYGPVFGVRTLDALHVACAMELRVKRFWTFDERQARLAAAAGLDTEI